MWTPRLAAGRDLRPWAANTVLGPTTGRGRNPSWPMSRNVEVSQGRASFLNDSGALALARAELATTLVHGRTATLLGPR